MNIETNLDFEASVQPFEDQHLAISFFKVRDIFVVELSGGIVGRTAGDLLDALTHLVDWGCKKLILDVSNVRVVNRAGLRGVVVAAKMLQTSVGEMRICGAHGDVQRAFSDLYLRHLIHLDPDRNAALAEFEQGQDAPGNGHFNSLILNGLKHVDQPSLGKCAGPGSTNEKRERDNVA